jgi:beta-ribofuranosylaminobenzene 5'-phosphate synthase
VKNIDLHDSNVRLQTSVTQVSVESSARLHMGFFDLNGGLGRKFGSIGLSLAHPTIHLNACLSDALTVSAVGNAIADTTVLKAKSIAQGLLDAHGLSGGVHIEMHQCVAAHAGLGSGTQLALAVGAVINRLYSLGLTTAEIAVLTGRGGRSGIGIAAFDVGGLLIDGGRTLTSKVPPILARYEFPDAWRVLLIFDKAKPGLHGSEEKLAFKELPVFPENLAAHLCRHVLMQAMPAMIEQDLTAFGQSIQALQAHTGDYFAPAQGGRYASQRVGEVLGYLEQLGVACFGQSSWGPTGFAIFENQQIANQHLAMLQQKFTQDDLSWLVTKAQNRGAVIQTKPV